MVVELLQAIARGLGGDPLTGISVTKGYPFLTSKFRSDQESSSPTRVRRVHALLTEEKTKITGLPVRNSCRCE